MVRGDILLLGIAGAAFAGSALVSASRTEVGTAHAAAADAIPEVVDYNWDVRPILSQSCFSCHGNDPAHRKAGLRLDTQEAAYGTLPQNPRKHAIVPGNPGKSEMFVRISTPDADVRMPPVNSHKTMSPRDVAIIQRWIEQGAKYERHWAYLPVAEVKPETTDWDARAANAIDHYVYANLKKHGLSPSPEADRETLINRVSLDLTGLPPTLAEVDAFVADKSPDAYEKVVDRLLARPQHAERMAATWMDVARYADTNGYLFDSITAGQYPYRDWVISAFQRNLPYNTFVTWQLAGDLLPNATREQILATAFARSNKKSNEGGIINEEYRIEYRNERAELIGKAFLGQTVACARCHDHKYDAISQADYYSLAGFFNSVDEHGWNAFGSRTTPSGPTLSWPSPDQARTLAAKQAVIDQRRRERAAAWAAARTAAARLPVGNAPAVLAQDLRAAQQAYYPMEQWDRTGSFDLLFKAPDSTGAPAPAAPKLVDAAYMRPVATPTGKLAQDYLDKALDIATAKGLPLKGLSGDKRGFDEKKLVWSRSGVPGAEAAIVSNPHVVAGPPGGGKALAIDDTVATADKDVGKFDRTDPFSLDLWIRLAPKKVYDDVDILHRGATDGFLPGAGYRLSLAQNHLKFMLQNQAPYNAVEVVSLGTLPQGKWVHVTATYDGSSSAAGTKLYANGKPVAAKVVHDHLTRSIAPAKAKYVYDSLQFGGQANMPEFSKGAIDELRVFTKALSPVEVAYLHHPAAIAALPTQTLRNAVADVRAARDPHVAAADAALRDAVLDAQAVETKVPQVMVLADRREVRPTFVAERGVYSNLGKQVPVQALPSVFAYDKAKFPPNRLGLAEWLFDPQNPLTARVYVNRLWQMHFGTGIVETLDDFGVQGATPSNPHLLDWLAAEFVRSGWDIRHINKLIVMSATYRQSSDATPAMLKADPRDTWLARAPRYRLPAEMIRDGALAASGLLADRQGGDSVFPYHPDQVWGDTGNGFQAYPDGDYVPQDQYHRRTLYSFIKRNAQFPSLAVFDLPDRNVSNVTRSISNTPLQSLVLLNDVQYREAYRKIAERAMLQTQDPDQQMALVFRLFTRRRPTTNELAALRQFRQRSLDRFAAHPADAAKITSLGVAAIDPRVDRVQLAALSEVAAVTFNSPDAYSLR